jgi:hypothetical protein
LPDRPRLVHKNKYKSSFKKGDFEINFDLFSLFLIFS